MWQVLSGAVSLETGTLGSPCLTLMMHFSSFRYAPPKISEPKEAENPCVGLGETDCKMSWSLARAPTGELRKPPWER